MQRLKDERDFHHPYEPYDIQKQFMNAVYDCLEDGKVGIFESPTGTGKSLSLICGSLTWLRDYKRRTLEDGLAADTGDSDEPAWILEHARKQRKHVALARKQDLEDRIAKIKAKEKQTKDRYVNEKPRYKRQKTAANDANDDVDEAQFALNDYESDNDGTGRHKPQSVSESGLSTENQVLLEQLGYSSKPKEEDADEVPDDTKIFFCSRTHSQLTQFSSELSRVKMPPAITQEVVTQADDEASLAEDVKYLTLGSRKNLCINPKVNTLRHSTAINERCMELQQPNTPSESKCPFMPRKENEALVNEFRDHALAKVRDIEDLGVLGKKLGICSYYASRPATKYCEIVALPYPLLLQKSAREALDLSLKDHIVIIDEAHNLMDAIAGVYSVSVTLHQAQEARTQLTIYLQHFRNKLKGKNRVYVAQILRLIDSVVAYLQAKASDIKMSDGIVDIRALLTGKGLDQINVYKLNAYLQKSRLARKVDGYTTYAAQARDLSQENTEDRGPRQTVPVLTQVQALLLALMNPSEEGRFFYSSEEASSVMLKYMLLDPTFHFKDVVEDARAVVLAGGTMSPMSDYEDHLLSYLDRSNILTLSCGHVIPSSSLLAVPMIDLAHTILSLVQHVPDGVVVFFPSYSYLDTCTVAWKRIRSASLSGSSSLWDSILDIKPIFLEQRSQPSSNNSAAAKEDARDSVLVAYSSAIASGKGRGAVLFAVIGGTLSEGINFSDALGRAVAVIGLPFPNPHSAEWKAKSQYIFTKATSQGRDGKAAARDFYENVCMRAVNQSVGRAIRHRGDYAAILLLDRRYAAPRIQAKLPRWIQNSLADGTGIREVEKRLDRFFAEKDI
ncbi:ATP-dependent DNA helicase chl1 [Didymosphaeria variabile]|uniref:ATP-dependent DNA helicase CHL1 n=1 Tax=Didymosphaeria variabile TaxID=1932322 RepID=A0A9W8XCZ3_9PLEO|nr:ATP-dependent DNA helicase chl1 [Didymosphaeria variabile]KAJ4346932.1 ATP-dependent DNA helicase chl1 [Didymosphaeria variabile]